MAQLDYVVEIPQCDGDSQRKQKAIDLQSFFINAMNDGSFSHGTGGGTGKAYCSDARFTARTSIASAKLLAHCTKGAHLDKITVRGYKQGGEQAEVFTLELHKVIITSIEIGSASGMESMDNFTVNYKSFSLATKAQRDDGGQGGVVTAKWNYASATENVS
jgi:type VI secretion system secreted protein Hcp